MSATAVQSDSRESVSPAQQGRLKIFSVPMRFIVEFVHWLKRPQGWLTVPAVGDMPSDIEVVSVSANWSRRSFEVMVASAEFDVVEQGYEPSRIPFGEEYDLRIAQVRVVDAKTECGEVS